MTSPARSGTPPHLVVVGRGDEAPPLFLVHSMAGELTWLPPLATRLGGSRLVAGFSAPGLMHPAPPFASIEAMAEAYLEEALAAAPSGPLVLGGYSFGGLVAFEMTRQALVRRREVTQLVLLDSHAPGSPPIRALPRWARNGTLVQVAANALGLQWNATHPIAPGALDLGSSEAQVEAAAAHLREHSAAPYPPETLREHLHRGLRVMAAHAALMAAYRLLALPGDVPVLFVRATRGFVGAENPLRLPRLLQRDPDPTPAWAPFLRGPWEHAAVDAEHFLLCQPPALEALAATLRRSLA